GVLVPAVGEDLGEELVQGTGVPQLVLRDRADRDVLFEEWRDAGPLGIGEAADELVVGHRQEELRERRARRAGQGVRGRARGPWWRRRWRHGVVRLPPVRSWPSERAAGFSVPARARAAASLSRITYPPGVW